MMTAVRLAITVVIEPGIPTLNISLKIDHCRRTPLRAGMKPIATVPHSLRTVDVSTGDTASAHHQRSDVCAVPAAGVVAEAMVALVLAEACLEKFGGDSVAETARNHAAYLASIPEAMRTW